MELQTVFYIVGIVFMGVMLLLVIALLTAVLVIKAKISKFHDALDTRLNQVKKVTDKIGMIVRTARHFTGH